MNRTFLISALATLALLAVIAFFAFMTLSPRNETTLLSAAVRGGDYLVRHTSDQGYFDYEYNPLTGETSSSYNILRHAGTTYSMLELYEVTNDPKLLSAAERALAFLAAQAKPCLNTPDAKCIVEANEIKLGGNGLAVLAFAKYTEVTGSDKYLPLAQELARFLIDVQSPEGEFKVHKMSVDGEVDDFVSGYYPGEALFGLARLSAQDGNREWLDAAHLGARWLIEVRDGGKSIDKLDHDHWLLYALNELHADSGDTVYLEHAKKITDAIIALQHRDLTGERAQWNGGYYNPPRSTPTATRSEGLSAATRIFMRVGDTEYEARAREAIRQGVAFQLRTQMTPGRVASLGAEPAALGGFHESLSEFNIRIDYVQHNISALLGARSLSIVPAAQ